MKVLRLQDTWETPQQCWSYWGCNLCERSFSSAEVIGTSRYLRGASAVLKLLELQDTWEKPQQFWSYLGVKILERSLSSAQVTETFKSHERSLSSAEVFEASRYVREASAVLKFLRLQDTWGALRDMIEFWAVLKLTLYQNTLYIYT